MTARVAWIALTPVKATRLHLVEEAELLESGVRGDRRFYVISDRNRLVNAKGFGSLQLVDADYDEDADALTMRVDDSVIAGEIARGGGRDELPSPPAQRTLVDGPWAQRFPTSWARVHLVEPSCRAATAVERRGDVLGRRRSRALAASLASSRRRPPVPR